jgi:drug/metabolite transporter (DMT)-like permease
VWLLFAAMALFPHLLGHTMLNWALRWVKAPVVSLSVLAEPVVSSLLAAVLFSEWPGALALPGAAVTLAAVLHVMRTEAKRPKSKDAAPVAT